MIYGDEPMKNCLSGNSFANLLFVNVQIGDVRATALFDTGAGMTVIAQSLLRRKKKSSAPETITAWFVRFRLPSFPISGWEMFAWKAARCS